MSLDKETIRRVAGLANLEMDEAALERMTPQVSGIMQWIEQLQGVNTEGVEPLANVANIAVALRPDVVNDGDCLEKILATAPEATQGFFVVPKVVE